MNHETLLVGFLVSMAYYELTSLYPGGIVVPAFLALYASEPLRLVGTAAVCLASLGAYRLLSARLLLFGRRRFFVLVMTAGLLSAAGGVLFPALFPAGKDLRAIGLVIPGLLANTCRKQGTAVTLASACVATAATSILSRLLQAF